MNVIENSVDCCGDGDNELNMLNIAGYKFCDLKDKEYVKNQFFEILDESYVSDEYLDDKGCLKRELVPSKGCQYKIKGNILISNEGINIFATGYPIDIHPFLKQVGERIVDEDMKKFDDIEYKTMKCKEHGFNRMTIRIKKEIISMKYDELAMLENQKSEKEEGEKLPEQISPSFERKLNKTHISPETLHNWYKEGKDMVILDTRNTYEYKVGTFKDAVYFDIEKFSDFPEQIKNQSDLLEKSKDSNEKPILSKDKPIVMFCTGGVRCEKAHPYMVQQGFNNIYQLDGGIIKYILKYNEELKKKKEKEDEKDSTEEPCFFEGECFVFDKRITVDPLNPNRETGTKKCYNCRSILTKEDQKSPLFVDGEKCPYCEDAKSKRKEQHQEWIKKVSTLKQEQ